MCRTAHAAPYALRPRVRLAGRRIKSRATRSVLSWNGWPRMGAGQHRRYLGTAFSEVKAGQRQARVRDSARTLARIPVRVRPRGCGRAHAVGTTRIVLRGALLGRGVGFRAGTQRVIRGKGSSDSNASANHCPCVPGEEPRGGSVGVSSRRVNGSPDREARADHIERVEQPQAPVRGRLSRSRPAPRWHSV
jgi:hypothetical protein